MLLVKNYREMEAVCQYYTVHSMGYGGRLFQSKFNKDSCLEFWMFCGYVIMSD